jgi:cell division protein FtsA
MMPKQDIAVGLDIGTTKVAICVGRHKEGAVEIMALAKAPNSGLLRGMVSDIEETVSAISAVLEEAERISNTPITSVYIGIGGAHINSVRSKGVIAVSRADGEIAEEDVKRVIDAARAIALPPNQEIIHVIPLSYTIDGQEGIKDPIGMQGVRLEVETHVIGGSTAAIKNLTKCIEQAGLRIDGMTFPPLATSKTLLSKKQKEIGAVLVDIGAGTTQLSIFEEGEMIHCNILPVGSMHISHDIGIGLRISPEAAEKIKLKYATALSKHVKEDEQINLANFDPNEKEKVSKKYIAEIVDARLDEIFSMIRNELKKIGKDGTLPAGVIFTGGGAKLEGLIEYSKENLRLPAQIGYPIMEISGMVDKLDDPVYTTSVGLMLMGLEESSFKKTSTFNVPHLDGVSDKIKSFFKNFMP